MADERFLSRELSWIAFNERVLELASEPGIPLLERAKFCAITSTNLDEFFQVRVAGLKDQIVAGIDRASMDGRTPTQQLTAIGELIPPLVERLDAAFLDRLVPELRGQGDRHRVVRRHDGGRTTRPRHVLRRAGLPGPHAARRRSRAPVPVHLRPRAVARGHRGRSGDRRPAVRPAQGAERVPAARRVSAPGRYLPVEQLIAARLDRLFVGMVIEEWAPFRVSRNADLTLEEEEADDLLEAVEMELRRRRFNRAVRLEVAHDVSEDLLELLVRELELTPADVTFHRSPIDLSCLWELLELERPDLKDPPWPPVTAGRIAAAEAGNRPVFDVVRHRALLVHHPYESFSTSVEAFISRLPTTPACSRSR